MISDQKRNSLQKGISDLSDIDEIFKEIENKISNLEVNVEDIITAAINADEQSELTDKTVQALCKLIDSLRNYNCRVNDLKSKLKEVTTLL